ncbi:hypothetical protein D3C81_1877510 [compost metagenome]
MPAGGRGRNDMALGVLALNVKVQQLESVGIDFHTHVQQLAAHILAIALEQLHGHGPFAPVAQGISKTQQAPEIDPVA